MSYISSIASAQGTAIKGEIIDCCAPAVGTNDLNGDGIADILIGVQGASLIIGSMLVPLTYYLVLFLDGII